jgi:glycosyltransferase involved in cell wall biosynthesis
VKLPIPKISVVIPLYNKADSILETIKAVLAQTLQDFEVVVVNDGSTDGSASLVASVHDTRLRLISQPNAGVSEARNRGIEEARANLIAFLDADDLWESDYLERIINLSEDFPQAEWMATAYRIEWPDGHGHTVRLNRLPKGFTRGLFPNYFDVATCSDPPVCSSATVVKRAAIQSIGGFPLGIASGEDLLTWARLAARYPLAYDIRSLAVFQYSGIHRRADPENRVGHALMVLLFATPSVPGLRSYVALWHRMQAVTALRFDDAALGRARAWQAMCLAPFNLRNFYTGVLSLLPSGVRRGLDGAARHLLRSIR